MRFPIVIQIVKPGDARGWIGLGCFILVLVILGMIAIDQSLLRNDAFLILATAIVVTGWVNGPVGWAYQATKGGGELADANAEALKQRAASDATSRHPDNVDAMNVEAETVTVNKGKKP